MEGFSYETEIIDHMSGPAHKGAESLEELAKAALHAEMSIKGIGSIAVGELLFESVKKLGEGVTEFAEGMADVAIEGVHFALEMSEFKENAIAAYASVTGTAEEGEEAFDQIEGLGKDIHLPVERAHEMAQQLMEQGLENMQEVEGVIHAVSDLQRTGNERGAQKLQRLVEKSLASGTFEAKGKALAGTGVSMPELAAQLAEDLHKPVSAIKGEMKAGRITAEEGIGAIEAVFSKSKIHQIAAAKFTLTDLTTDLKNDFRGLFEDVNAGPLLDAFHDLAWVFGESTDKAGGLKAGITDLFDWVNANVAPIIDEFIVFGQDVEIGFLRAYIATKPIREEFEKIGMTSGDWETVELTIQGVAEALVTAAIYAARLVNAMIAVVEEITGLGPAGEKAGGGLAMSIVEGFSNALTQGSTFTARIMDHLVHGTIQAGRNAAEAHSPARTGIDLGSDIAEGVMLGIDDGRAEVERSMAALSTLPDSGDTGEASGGRSVVIHEGAIQAHVHVNGTNVSHDDIKETVTAALEDVTEQLILELGG